MSEFIIDILKEEYKEFPITLDGEVLLEKTYDSRGNFSGYLTTKKETILEMKKLTDAELEASGGLKYKNILDSFV